MYWGGRARRASSSPCPCWLLVPWLTPAPARAEDVITTQGYFSYYHLDTARAKGYTGKGVTVP